MIVGNFEALTARVAWVGLFLAMAALSLPTNAHSSEASTGVERGWTLKLPLVAGRERLLSEQEDSTFAFDAPRTVVHFWASWCGPCAEELPTLARFYERTFEGLHARGVDFISVSLDARKQDLDDFLHLHHLPFPVFLDSLGRFHHELGLPGLPVTVVLDPQRRVLSERIGPVDWESPETTSWLESQIISVQQTGPRDQGVGVRVESEEKEHETTEFVN